MGVRDRDGGVSVPRFHVPDAAPGARLALPDHLAHHARDVLRVARGGVVRVFDGRGGEYAAEVEEVTRQGVRLHVAGAVEPRPESALRLLLAVAPLKGDLMELVVQKATELGAAEVLPVVTARTDAVARPALKGTRQERWEKVAAGAAEQCGRAVVPRIAPATTLSAFLATSFDARRLILDEQRGGASLRSLGAAPPSVLLLVGPAGGWEPREVAAASAAGFERVSLGPRVLRAETAAIAALAALQALWGDLG
jgi:16S rRNA (uracil1498-N3)-methyltransferase